MKRITHSFFFFFFLYFLSPVYSIYAQITPGTNSELCPHPDYQSLSLAAYGPNTIEFKINFGSLSPDNYTISTSATSNPIQHCRVLQNIIKDPNNASLGIVSIVFEDQHAGVPQFTVVKTGTTTAYATYKFPYIRSLKTIAPVVSFPAVISLPLCTSGTIPYSMNPVKYKKLDDNTEFGNPISFYEYSVPRGWKVGTSVSTGLNNYILASPNATITSDLLNSGSVKIRAVQTGSPCAQTSTSTPSPGEWATITNSRPALSLKCSGLKAITINCAEINPRTFTVENANLLTCVSSYKWMIGGGWLRSDGTAAPSTIITTTNSLTLIPVSTLAQPPSNVAVEIVSGTSTFNDIVTVSQSNNKPPLSISGDNTICSSKKYQLAMGPGYRFTGTAAWSVTPLGLVSVNADAADPSNDKKVTVTNTAYLNKMITLTATYKYSACSTDVPIPKTIVVGTINANNVGMKLNYYNPNGTQFCRGTPFSFEVKTQDGVSLSDYGITSVQWKVVALPGPAAQVQYNAGSYFSTSSSYINGSAVTIKFPISPSTPLSNADIQVNFQNSCGWTAGDEGDGLWMKPLNGIVPVSSTTCSGGTLFSISPNPAIGTLVIRANQSTVSSKQKYVSTIKERHIKIFDSRGNLKKEVTDKGQSKQININVANLPTGMYFVEISGANEKSSYPVIIHQ